MSRRARHAFAGAALVALKLCSSACATDPYQVLTDRGAAFLGPGRELEPPDTLSCVRLGLIGPSQGDGSLQLRHGAQMAVAEANAAGGYRGVPYVLVFRPDDGPWGVVPRQVVALSQEDQVWVVIGCLDGERAHAAELVAAKTWVPVVTPAAGDLTIDYANVPWVFRLAPTDRLQADLLLDAAAARGWDRVALVYETVRDARLAAERVLEAARQRQRTLALAVEFDPREVEPTVTRVLQAHPDAVLAWGTPAGAAALMAGLQRAQAGLPLLVPSTVVAPRTAPLAVAAAAPAPALGAAAADLAAPDSALQAFRVRFRQDAGTEAGTTALLTYDATRMCLQAIASAGLNRARIRDALAAQAYSGVVGPVSLNSLGGSQARPVLVQAAPSGWIPADTSGR